ncbi:MAG: nitrogenase [Peptococcaceae bacterium BICA1-7]|nr:MAG: nitrogenase [Peptococcaceae bacterium BICA1-7]HBV97517.1 nitrogenase [Desulfotomaculum sp.]
MGAEIAVHVGESGLTASLYEKGKVIVYRRNMGSWIPVREKEFMLDLGLGMRETREKMREVAVFLSGCGVLVGLNVTGVPYFELEKAGLSIWEYQGSPADFLDAILEKEEEERSLRGKGDIISLPVPEEVAGGCYRVSIKGIQEGNTGLTSKQALLPFIRSRVFYSLEIMCSHAPPWLEAEIKGGSLSGEIKSAGGGVVVTIKNSCCV